MRGAERRNRRQHGAYFTRRAHGGVSLKSQKIAGAAAEIFAKKNLNNDCASKTTLLRPHPQYAVRHGQEK